MTCFLYVWLHTRRLKNHLWCLWEAFRIKQILWGASRTHAYFHVFIYLFVSFPCLWEVRDGIQEKQNISRSSNHSWKSTIEFHKNLVNKRVWTRTNGNKWMMCHLYKLPVSWRLCLLVSLDTSSNRSSIIQTTWRRKKKHPVHCSAFTWNIKACVFYRLYTVQLQVSHFGLILPKCEKRGFVALLKHGAFKTCIRNLCFLNT